MRHHDSFDVPPPAQGAAKSRWAALRNLAPYLWQYRLRVSLALVMLLAAKVANVGVPLVLKDIVNALEAVRRTNRDVA